jgi:hypothetical protein
MVGPEIVSEYEYVNWKHCCSWHFRCFFHFSHAQKRFKMKCTLIRTWFANVIIFLNSSNNFLKSSLTERQNKMLCLTQESLFWLFYNLPVRHKAFSREENLKGVNRYLGYQNIAIVKHSSLRQWRKERLYNINYCSQLNKEKKRENLL